MFIDESCATPSGGKPYNLSVHPEETINEL